jgi:hypothetical protein
MESLFDKLKPEYKLELEKNTANFPSFGQSVINALKNNKSWLNLTFGEVIDLMQLTTTENTTITNVDNLFSREK